MMEMAVSGTDSEALNACATMQGNTIIGSQRRKAVAVRSPEAVSRLATTTAGP